MKTAHFLLAVAFLASCSSSSPGTDSNAGGGPDSGGGPDGGPGSWPDGGTGPTATEPDFGPEGQAVCPAAHFCLEFPRATTADIDALAVTPAGSLWAVGSNGTILHSHSKGGAWATVPSGVTTELRAVLVIGPDTWIAGDAGTLLRLDGNAFRPQTTGTNADFRAMWASGPNDVWLVGNETPEAGAAHGAVLHFDGTSWSHVADAALPFLNDVSGSGPGDVWVGGGSLESIALFHLVGGAWKAAPDAISLARDVEGPIRGVVALGPTEVVVSTLGVNFCNLLRFDGAAWTDEDDVIQSITGSVVRGLARGPGGALWTVSDPPLARANGAWQKADGVPTFGTTVNALVTAGSDVCVGGRAGLVGRAADPALIGPTDGVYSAKAFAGGNIVRTPTRALVQDPNLVYKVALKGGSLAWLGGTGPTDLAAIDIYEGTGDLDDPNRRVDVYRWDGTNVTHPFTDSLYMKELGPLGMAPNGGIYWETTTYDASQHRTGNDFGVLARGSSTLSTITCNGVVLPAVLIWTDGKDTVVRADDGTTVQMVHMTSAGCTQIPRASWFYWESEAAIGGTSYSDLWTIAPDFSDPMTPLTRFDGTTSKVVATAQIKMCSMLFFADTDIWLAPCADATDNVLLHWNGASFESVPIGVTGYGRVLWGTDAAHMWLASDGLVLRYRP